MSTSGARWPSISDGVQPIERVVGRRRGARRQRDGVGTAAAQGDGGAGTATVEDGVADDPRPDRQRRDPERVPLHEQRRRHVVTIGAASGTGGCHELAQALRVRHERLARDPSVAVATDRHAQVVDGSRDALDELRGGHTGAGAPSVSLAVTRSSNQPNPSPSTVQSSARPPSDCIRNRQMSPAGTSVEIESGDVGNRQERTAVDEHHCRDQRDDAEVEVEAVRSQPDSLHSSTAAMMPNADERHVLDRPLVHGVGIAHRGWVRRILEHREQRGGPEGDGGEPERAP